MEANMETVQEGSISRIRNRDSVLGLVVPKILGILYTRGHKLHGFGGRSVRLNEAAVLSAASIDAHRLMISVYDGSVWEIVKVLSLHGTDFPSAMDTNFYRYSGGRAAVLSWRRGKWEDVIMADKTASLSIKEAFREGLGRTEIREQPRHTSPQSKRSLHWGAEG
jgi:hypothetical protein